MLLKGYHILMASIQSGLYADRELIGQLGSPCDAGTIRVDEIMFVLIAREAWSYLWPIMETISECMHGSMKAMQAVNDDLLPVFSIFSWSLIILHPSDICRGRRAPDRKK